MSDKTKCRAKNIAKILYVLSQKFFNKIVKISNTVTDEENPKLKTWEVYPQLTLFRYYVTKTKYI